MVLSEPHSGSRGNTVVRAAYGSTSKQYQRIHVRAGKPTNGGDQPQPAPPAN